MGKSRRRWPTGPSALRLDRYVAEKTLPASSDQSNQRAFTGLGELLDPPPAPPALSVARRSCT